MTRTAAVAAVARTWNGRAADHDRCYRAYPEAGRDAWRRLYREAIHTLLGKTGRPPRVLDVGTGTGFVAVLLAELRHDVTGMDDPVQMLDLARAEAALRGVTVRWRHSDGHSPPGGGYDLINCRYVLWTLPAPAAALAAWARALRPSGAVLVADSRWHTARQPELVPGAVRDYLDMGRKLPYWRGLTATRAAVLLRSTGLGPPRQFGDLLPGRMRQDSRDFFVTGATRKEQT